MPQFLSGGREEVGEFVRARPKVTDAIAAGQRGDVEQNSTAAREFHFVTIRRSAALGQGAHRPRDLRVWGIVLESCGRKKVKAVTLVML